MGIEREIVEWSASRATWQRVLLRRLARGEALSEADHAAVAEHLLAEKELCGEPLSLADMPDGESAAVDPIRLLAVQRLKNVNALLPDQTLTFGPGGMTAIYGDNGSGKSGYARLLKAVAHSRDQEDVRSDVFAGNPTDEPSATFVIQEGAQTREIDWPVGDTAALSAMGFFDERCGDKYVTTDTEVSYRPYAIAVLDGLIDACGAVRAALDDRLARVKQGNPLPQLEADTEAGRFLGSLSPSSDPDQLQALVQKGTNAEGEIEQLEVEAARLRSLDPAKERLRLLGTASRLERVADHLANVSAHLGGESESELAALHGRLRAAEEAVRAASQISFERDPLSGVGSAAWSVLWEAARNFALAGAEAGVAFPSTDHGARCVLCQQVLDEDAADRLRRFDAFVQGQVQASLSDLQESRDQARERLGALDADSPEIRAFLDDLDGEFSPEVAGARAFLRYATERRDALLLALDAATWHAVEPAAEIAPIEGFREASAKSRDRARSIEAGEHERLLQAVLAEHRELIAARTVAKHRDSILVGIEQAVLRARMERAKSQTATNAISSKRADLMRTYVTTTVLDQFKREADRLQLSRVALRDAGARKGVLRHQVALVGAVQAAPLPRVLSEGEQTALGLAGFFTEAALSSNQTALILDDPVSSLDHRRRNLVAARLAEFAKERQVIVFTHDLAFLADLSKAADGAGVPLTERSVERMGSGKPGACRNRHPWKAKEASERLHELENDLARLERERNVLDLATYEGRITEWGGKLSETWERLIVQEVIGQVFEVGTQEVRPQKFRLLAKVDESDDMELQASYSRCSQWARRHDKSLATNWVAPEIEELRKELTVVRAWFKRVKAYRS